MSQPHESSFHFTDRLALHLAYFALAALMVFKVLPLISTGTEGESSPRESLPHGKAASPDEARDSSASYATAPGGHHKAPAAPPKLDKEELRTSAIGEDIAWSARGWVGLTDYEWGGEDLWGGADCSGFVQSIFRSYGVMLPRTAAQQYRHQRATSVSKGELRPGDLVFFCCTYAREGITHVGIYDGHGRFVHAASESQGVKVSGLSESFYRKRFVGGKRYYASK